jgi:Protein of unknown function (DUF2939)
MKYVIGAIAVIIVAALGWLFVAPLMAANELRLALQSEDTIAIERHVDFPALRDNLRGGLSAAMTDTNDPKNGIEMIGKAIAGAFVSPLMDLIITPQGLSAIYKNGVGGITGRTDAEVQVSGGLQGLDRYNLVVTDTKKPENSVVLIMMPRGLQWKLVGLKFNPQALK